MAHKRKKKIGIKKPKIEKEYWEEVEITDPNTGKKIKQRVKITRYKSGPLTCEPACEGDLLDKISNCDHDDTCGNEFED